MSILWHWAVIVCEWIGALYMLALAAVFVITGASVLAGSILAQRHWKVAGIAPPGHPDLDVTLGDDEVAVIQAIAAALEGRHDAGLAILDHTEGEQA